MISCHSLTARKDCRCNFQDRCTEDKWVINLENVARQESTRKIRFRPIVRGHEGDQQSFKNITTFSTRCCCCCCCHFCSSGRRTENVAHDILLTDGLCAGLPDLFWPGCGVGRMWCIPFASTPGLVYIGRSFGAMDDEQEFGTTMTL